MRPVRAVDLWYWAFHVKNRSRYEALRRSSEDYSLAGFDRLGCIFVHIPKCGGVSVNRALFGNLGGGHRTIADYRKIYGPQESRRYFVFTFVRNPFSRLVSAYDFMKKGGMNEEDRRFSEAELAECSSFSEFVMERLGERRIRRHVHFRPQHEFVCEGSGPPQADFVGRFERIEADFERLCERLGVRAALPHRNASGGNGDYLSRYTPETAAEIARAYERDFELFGYDPRPALSATSPGPRP